MEFGPILRALSRNRIRTFLIVVQIAITLAVVTNAVSMIVAERARMEKQSGFDDDNLLWVHSEPFADEFQQRPFRIATTQSDLRALRAVPGVRSVVNTSFLPWQGGGSSGDVQAAGGDGSMILTQQYTASPGFIDTLGIHIVSGRDLHESDVDLDPNSTNSRIMISRALEQLMFKDKSAVGHQILNHGSVDTVVGVFDPFYNPYGWPIHEYCIIYPGIASYGGASFLVRLEPGAMKRTAPVLEKALLTVNSGRNTRSTSIATIKDQFFNQGHVVIYAMTSVILLIVIVTGLGIVGMTSFAVTERTRQIGTRRALGATKTAILRYFLLENWIITNLGLMLGVFLAYGLNYLLVTNTAGLKLDWRYVAAGVALLWAQGVVATLAPAMRASAVSPVVATRAV